MFFSLGDMGLRRAVEKAYQLPDKMSGKQWRQEAERITAPWRPWRSVASRYLWAAYDQGVIF